MEPGAVLLIFGAVLIWASVGVLTNEFMYSWLRKRTGRAEYPDTNEVIWAMIFGPIAVLIAVIVLIVNKDFD